MIGSSGLKILPVDNLDEAARWFKTYMLYVNQMMIISSDSPSLYHKWLLTPDTYFIIILLFFKKIKIFFRLSCKLSKIVAISRDAHLDVKFEMPI